MNKTKKQKKHILAVASAGGHWVELMRIMSTFSEYRVDYISTNAGYISQIFPAKLYTVNDASMWNKFGLLKMAVKILWLLIRLRPDVIISTGAAPGFFALFFGKLFRVKTIWVDSIANADELSLAGRRVKPFADLWLTQWPHLEDPTNGPSYKGSIL